MKTPEEILNEVAAENMINIQQMVTTKQLAVIAMRRYAKLYHESKVKNLDISLVSKRCIHCLYRKYRPNAKHRYELNQCQISGHNLTDVENHSCEHYKPIPNVC